jgi:hypothetical protein
MTTLLVVPVHLDALYLAQDRYVTEPTADFTRLPHIEPMSGQDVHADLPYLSEIILSKPFQDQRLQLKKGIHLHWALPDALTQAEQRDGQTYFHAVPNRWLITRTRDTTIEEQWIVESDFVSNDNPSGVSYPAISAQLVAARPWPFCYLGRRLPLSAWAPATDRSSYLTKLTAVGYGEPTFAAFYPNCHSVFGFHDPDYADQIPAGLRYELVGWYGDRAQDALAILLDSPAGQASWRDALAQALEWTAPSNAPPPERMVCYAQITFAPERTMAALGAASETGVSVANTATEALAAHLGSQIEGLDKDELENLLEALAFADQLEQKQIDVGPKLLEERHSNTFRQIPAGLLWTIRRQDETGQAPDALQADRQQQAILPHDLADKLNLLNLAQDTYDRAWREVAALREQLFADWYKYMLCVYPPETSRESYPDPDEVVFFLRKTMARLQDRIATAGTFPPQAPGDTLAQRLYEALQTVTSALQTVNTALAESKTKYTLQQIAAPQYYLPTEPVMLLTGNAATPTDRHGRDGRLHPDGLLTCYVLDDQRIGVSSADALRALHARIAQFFAALKEPSFAVNTWRDQPWHPILLQWEVEFFPMSAGNNLDPEDRSYRSGFILENYLLAEQDAELKLRDGKNIPDKGANTYSGTTILSPVAAPLLRDRILTYLEKHALPEYYEAKKIPLEDRDPQKFRDDPGTVLAWYRAGGTDERIKTLIQVYDHLQTNSGSNLSQLLGGFNDALVMQKVTRQLPVADPLGFEPYKTFTERDVREAVGSATIRAPQPLQDFNPIRAGALRVLQLRLIDNFGIVHDVDVSRITTTTQMRVPEYPEWVALPPRLAQPARLNFRWLDADHDIQEMNNLPETSPICGWLLPNNLDDNIAVYDDRGRGLGVIYALDDPRSTGAAQWRPLPGSPSATAIEEVANPHLRKVVQRIHSAGAEFVGSLIEALDTALATIDPEDYAQHRGQALLIGRPIAVVRARVDLELMGSPAIHQDWNVFRLDMHRSTRETNNFTQVLFPIRIGEYHQLNDGLLGYWQETASLELGDAFYAAQSGPSAHERIVTYDQEPINIYQAIDAPPNYLTMLVDPRAVVHATSGILPTKSIGIPAEHYRDALQSIEVTFFSAPILSDADQLDLPLPSEAGYLWSWLQRGQEGWQETSTLSTIRRAAFVVELTDGAAIWSELLALGWLQPIDEETAAITPPEQRKPLDGQRAADRERIEALLDQPAIGAPKLQAHFPTRPTVHEGWLKLRKANVERKM